jgi:NitT/TauT family transport system ATP-binding protein
MMVQSTVSQASPPLAAATSVLQFTDVVKKYTSERGSVTALNGISLDVKEGEFLTIVGPSGCGKSTLLNILVGLETPSSGTVVLDGAKAVDRRAVGYVMQNDNLYPWRTLRENVEFPLELRKIPSVERRQISQRYLEKVQLADFADAYPYELSGGMRQRGQHRSSALLLSAHSGDGRAIRPARRSDASSAAKLAS